MSEFRTPGVGQLPRCVRCGAVVEPEKAWPCPMASDAPQDIDRITPLTATKLKGVTVVSAPACKHSHYFKNVSHLKEIDVYRVLKLFNVTDPCVQHAVKKLLVAGGRGAGKDMERDLREAVDSINRALQMIAEDDVPQQSRDSLQP